MILTADGGSTKCDWALADDEGVRYLSTRGLNPFACDDETIARILDSELLSCLDAARVEAVYFYGAGCIFDGAERTARALGARFAGAHIEVESDMAGAARALYGNGSGIAAILGTGSNSCLYDGRRIVHNVPPLGYILGDEGSGAVLGRTLVGDVLKRQLPSDICDEFHSRTGLDRLTIINNVYRQPGANKFLASLVPFLSENISRPEIRNLVLGSFVSFFRRNVRSYAGHESIPCGFVGSVAYYFADVLREAAAVSGCKVGTILKAPMDGLIKYHSLNKLSAI